MDADVGFMGRALELARTPAFTSPNPRVGAVVVRAGKVLGEAAHEGAGSAHAEPQALDRAGDAAGATVYVNLEPCVHEGRTPPCVRRLISSGVARVVCSIEDPDARVAGAGIAALRAAGIEVTTGVLANEAESLNAPYLHHRRTRSSFVTLKLALSADGRMSAPDGSSRWITGRAARRLVHARRVEADAVLVGSGTVLADDPSLTARDIPASRQPLRVIVDSRGRVPAAARALGDGALVATTERCSHETQTAWKEAGAEVVVLPPAGERVDLGDLLRLLGARDVVETLCEGGAVLATSLLRAELVDRLELFYGPLLLGRGGSELGDVGISSMAGASRWRTISVERLDDDVRVIMDREAA